MTKTDEPTTPIRTRRSPWARGAFVVVIAAAVVAQLFLNATLAGAMNRMTSGFLIGSLWSMAGEQIRLDAEEGTEIRVDAEARVASRLTDVAGIVESGVVISEPILDAVPCDLPGSDGQQLHAARMTTVIEVEAGRGAAVLEQIAALELSYMEPAEWSHDSLQVRRPTPRTFNSAEVQVAHDAVVVTLEEAGSADRLHIAASEGCYLP